MCRKRNIIYIFSSNTKNIYNLQIHDMFGLPRRYVGFCHRYLFFKLYVAVNYIKICKYIENICCFFRYVCDSRNCKSNSKNDASAYFLLRAAEPFQRNTYSEKGQKFAWQQEEGVQWPFVARFTQPCICRASSRGVEIGNSKLVEAYQLQNSI